MLPNGLIQSLEKVVGFDKEAFETVHKTNEVVTSIRKNSEKNNTYNFDNSSPVLWCNQGVYLEKRPSFVFDPLWHAGAYYVQEASSMFLWHISNYIFEKNTNKLVLDLCAAPGGKTTLLSDFFKDGLVVSNEVIKPRAAILQENVTKWGSNNIVITNNDAEHFKNLNNLFDAIFIDAPCSGSGLFRKDKDAIKEWSENNVALCSQRQKKIITNIINCVKDDGYLVYSTCSYSQEENEDIADWIVDNFNVETVNIPIQKDWGIVLTSSPKNKAIGYRFYPYFTKGEGFFVTVFRSKNTKNEAAQKTSKSTKIITASKREIEFTKHFVNEPEHVSFIKHIEDIIAIPKEWQPQIELLAQQLYLKKIGSTIGQIKQQEIIPSHDVATSIIKSKNIANIEIDKENAIKYLQKKEIELNTSIKGWALLFYCGVSIGFVKVLPNRINNYYPKEWRILKDYF